MNVYNENQEMGSLAKWGIVLAVIGVVVVAILALGFGLLEGPLTNLRWKAWQGSNTNIQGLQTELSSKIGNYADLDTKIALYKDNPDVLKSYCAQQKVLLGMFYEAYDKLQSADKSAISADLGAFVLIHPRNSVSQPCR